MTLREKQSKFVKMIAQLIEFAYSQGYELTFGDAYRGDCQGHMEGSLHYIRLAVDFNLFKDGKYLTKTEDYKLLGEYWESIGGSWGGRFGAGPDGIGTDGNHFSLEHGGRK